MQEEEQSRDAMKPDGVEGISEAALDFLYDTSDFKLKRLRIDWRQRNVWAYQIALGEVPAGFDSNEAFGEFLEKKMESKRKRGGSRKRRGMRRRPDR